MKYSYDDVIMYLDDINNFVNSIFYYHVLPVNKQKELDLQEIIMYLSVIDEIIQDIKDYIYNLYCYKN